MIITIKKGAPEAEVKDLIFSFQERGFEVNDSQGTDYHILGLIGDTTSPVSYTHLTLPTN